MKPERSLVWIAVLPSWTANASARATVSCEVSRPTTISTSVITGTGLKKCRPSTLSGRPVCAASCGDRDRGGVGSDRRLRLQELIEALEQVGLLSLILDDRLDHQIRVAEGVEVGVPRDPIRAAMRPLRP